MDQAQRQDIRPSPAATSDAVGSMSTLQKRRMDEAAGECNPFEEDWICCKKLKCTLTADKTYTIAQRRRFLVMPRVERKVTLRAFLQEQGYFQFNGKRVCSTFLIKALSFSNSMIAAVKENPAARSSSSVSVLPREGPTDARKYEVLVFLRRMADLIGGIMPDSNEIHLPYSRKSDVYEEMRRCYMKDRPATCVLPPVSMSYFFRVWKECASHIKVRKIHRFAKCFDCEFFRDRLAKAGLNEAKCRSLMQCKQDHIAFIRGEREEYAAKRTLGIRSPSKYCSIIVDGADQSAFGLPHFVYNTKNLKGEAIKVRLVGVKEHLPVPNIHLFLMTEEHETGANHIVETVHRVLTDKARKTSLPPVLFLQADNCARENKNRYLMAYMELLLCMGVFVEIFVSFLPVGHTHEDIDQVFSRTSVHLRSHEALTISQLARELEKAYSPTPVVSEMRNIANFSNLCENERCLNPVSNWTALRYFRFTRSSSQPRNSLESFAPECSAKVNAREEWKPFLHGRTFTRFTPDLRKTPPTTTKTLTNEANVKKRLDSARDNIANERILEDLDVLRTRVFTPREDSFHWELETAIELNGGFRSIHAAAASDLDPPAPELEARDYNLNYDYAPGQMVAIRPETNATTFWVAKIERIHKDNDGFVCELTVRWYEVYGANKNDPYKAKYAPAVRREGSVSRPRESPWRDTIDASSVFVTFDSLKADYTLHSATQKKIRNCLP